MAQVPQIASNPSDRTWTSPRSKDARRAVVLGRVAPPWRAACRQLGTQQWPRPLTDDEVLTCCLSAEGVSVSVWGRSVSLGLLCLRLPCQGKTPRSTHTLLLVTAALHAQPSPSSFNKRLYLPLLFPSGLQQLISVPLTVANCVIIRYVNPMCQRAT